MFLCVAAGCVVVVECGEGGGGHDAPFIGVCALDTAAGQLLLGAWRDDEVRRGGDMTNDGVNDNTTRTPVEKPLSPRKLSYPGGKAAHANTHDSL